MFFNAVHNGGTVTDMMIEGSTGKVGIGTDSPQTILHIKGEGDKLRVDASDGTQILQIQEFTGQIADIIGPGNKALRINHNSSGDVFIGTGGGSVMLGNTVANPASPLNLNIGNSTKNIALSITSALAIV